MERDLTSRRTDRKTKENRQMKTDKQINGQRDTHTHIWTNENTDRYRRINGQAKNRQTNRKIKSQTHKWTDRNE